MQIFALWVGSDGSRTFPSGIVKSGLVSRAMYRSFTIFTRECLGRRGARRVCTVIGQNHNVIMLTCVVRLTEVQPMNVSEQFARSVQFLPSTTAKPAQWAT